MTFPCSNFVKIASRVKTFTTNVSSACQNWVNINGSHFENVHKFLQAVLFIQVSMSLLCWPTCPINLTVIIKLQWNSGFRMRNVAFSRHFEKMAATGHFPRHFPGHGSKLCQNACLYVKTHKYVYIMCLAITVFA